MRIVVSQFVHELLGCLHAIGIVRRQLRQFGHQLVHASHQSVVLHVVLAHLDVIATKNFYLTNILDKTRHSDQTTRERAVSGGGTARLSFVAVWCSAVVGVALRHPCQLLIANICLSSINIRFV